MKVTTLIIFIYLVTCTKRGCLQQYVGESGRKYQDRAPEHLKSIKNHIEDIEKGRVPREPTPVSRHFSENNHNVGHFSIQVIEKCQNDDTHYRRLRENFWELTLKAQINVIKSHIHDAFQ